MTITEVITNPIFVALVSIVVTASFKKYIEPVLPDREIIGKHLSKFIGKIFEFSFVYFIPFLFLKSSKWDSIQELNKDSIMGLVLGVSLLFFCISLHLLYYLRLKFHNEIKEIKKGLITKVIVDVNNSDSVDIEEPEND